MNRASLPTARGVLLFVLLPLCLLLGFHLIVSQPAVYAEENHPTALGSISGVVRNSAGEPLADMQLTLYFSIYYESNWQTKMQAMTDSSGRYRFSALPAGVYRIGVVDPDGFYGKSFYAGQNTVWAATDVVVNGEQRPAIDFTLTSGGVISGFVRAADGLSFWDQGVSLYQKAAPLYFGGGQATEWLQIETQYIPVSQTDFAFRGLASGVYRVCASSSANSAYWQECYDDVYNVADAQSFTITTGSVISDVVLVLGDGADLATISGRVTAAQDEPLANIGVYVVPFDAVPYYPTPAPPTPSTTVTPTAAPITGHTAQGATVLQPVATPTALPPPTLPSVPYRYYTHTAADGTYTVTNVFDGNYQIYFYDRAGRYRYEYYNDVTYRSNAASVIIAQQTPVAGINAQLALGAHLTGTISLFGQPAPVTTLYLYKQENNGWFIIATATSDLLTGNYDIGGLPAGVYRLQAAVTINYSVQTSYSLYGFYGGNDWSTATTIQLTTAEIRPNIDINLEQGPRFEGAISGRVTASGNPIAGVKVSLYNRQSGCCDSLFLGSALTYATTDQDGRYRINGLSDAIYHVRYEDPSGQRAAIFYPSQPVVDATNYVVTNDTQTITADAEMPAGGSIKGHVGSLAGTALPDLTMVAIFITPEQPGFIYRAAPLNADGSFLLPGLYPGNYRICAARQSIYSLGYYEFDCYGSFSDTQWYGSGKAIQVTAGQTVAGIDLLWGADYKRYLPLVAR